MFGRLKKHYTLFLSFFVPVLIMLAIDAKIQIHPFGPKSLLVIDLRQQYAPFLSYFREIFAGGHSLFYTFSKNLGGDMWNFFIYYLMSPFNLIVLFFPKDMLPTAIWTITLLKTGACGLTFGIYAKHTFKIDPPAVILFACCYALTGYNLAYQANLLWLDSVVLLPLAVLGLDRLLEKNQKGLFVLSLTAAILTQYTMAWMIGVFLILYFIYRQALFALNKENGRHHVLEAGRQGLRLLCASLLSLGISAAALAPVWIFYRANGGTINISDFKPSEIFPLFDLISKLYPGAFDYSKTFVAAEALPHIFCGLFPVLLALCYFFNRGVRASHKILTGALIGILAVSMSIEALDLFWHGLARTNAFPYRNAFILSFVLIAVGCFSFEKLDALPFQRIMPITFVAIGITLWVEKYDYTFLSRLKLFEAALCLLIYGLLLLLIRIFNSRTLCLLLCLAAVATELFLNGWYILGAVTTYQPKAEFDDYYKETSAVIREIQRDDPGFYRMEKNFQASRNDAMLLNYNGLTHHSLKDQKAVKLLMQRMGFRNYYNYWTHYRDGSTMTADALFGVKYLITKGAFSHSQQYVSVKEAGDITVYRNPYALPAAFMSNNNIRNQSISIANPFELQNQIYGSLTASAPAESPVPLYFPIPILETRLENVTENKEADVTVFTKTDKGKPGSVEYLLQMNHAFPAYAFFPSNTLKETRMYVNGESKGPYFTMDEYDVVGLGNFRAGDLVSFKFELTEDTVQYDEAWFYYLDVDRFEQVYRELDQNAYHISAFSDTRFSGTVEAAPGKNILFTSIPWDPGWQVRVDEQKAESIRLLDTFMGVELTPGTHQVEFKYHVPGLTAGIIVSVLSIGLLVLTLKFEINEKKNRSV